MKRTLLSLIGLFIGIVTFAQNTYQSGKFNVKLNGNNATIVGLAESDLTDIRIPSTVKINDVKYPVTAIAEGAFRNQTSLLSVSIGLNIATIGSNAFVGCSHLKTVYVYALMPPKGTGKADIFGYDDGFGSLVLPDNFTVYVSAGSVADFQNDATWGKLHIEPMVIKIP